MAGCGQRILNALLVLWILAGLGGCCAKAVRTPPPPISLEEQVSRLSQWSRQFPQLKAKTVLAGVRMEYRDEQGRSQAQDFEGTLLIRQHLTTESGSASAAPPEGAGADVFFLGELFNNPAFEAGRNDTDWWFAIEQKKVAFTGDSRRPVNLSNLARTSSVSIFRADLVMELLALAPLPANAMPSAPGRPFLLMRVNDFDATNDLLIEEVLPDGRPYLVREILVDRFTGYPSEVRFYDPSGNLVVRSELGGFAAVSYDEGVSKPAVPARFPKKITVSYPAQQTRIALQFEDVTVKAELPDRPFRTPEFEGYEKHIMD